LHAYNNEGEYFGEILTSDFSENPIESIKKLHDNLYAFVVQGKQEFKLNLIKFEFISASDSDL